MPGLEFWSPMEFWESGAQSFRVPWKFWSMVDCFVWSEMPVLNCRLVTFRVSLQQSVTAMSITIFNNYSLKSRGIVAEYLPSCVAARYRVKMVLGSSNQQL